MTSEPAAWVRLVSRERLSTYISECNGDLAAALDMYQWNTEVTGAFWEVVGHVEVALRNTLDDRLRTRHVARFGSHHWLWGPTCELSLKMQEDVTMAKRRVRQNKKKLTHGQVVSELPFGFWRFLVSKRYTNWWPDLASGFPFAPDRALATVEGPVQRIHQFRNRLGHHQRVWSEPLAARYRDMADLLGYMDPSARTWVDRRSRVDSVLSARPGDD